MRVPRNSGISFLRIVLVALLALGMAPRAARGAGPAIELPSDPSAVVVSYRSIPGELAGPGASLRVHADGREQVETAQNGRSIRVRAAFQGDALTITRTGERANDFTVTSLATTGKVTSFTIVQRAAPGVKVPFVSAVIGLDDGASVQANIVDTEPDPDHIALGMAVKLNWAGVSAVATTLDMFTNQVVALGKDDVVESRINAFQTRNRISRRLSGKQIAGFRDGDIERRLEEKRLNAREIAVGCSP